MYRVVMATILTEHLDPAAAAGEAPQPAPQPTLVPLLVPQVVAPQTQTDRPKLLVGEVLEVLEGPRKQEATGLTRIRVKVRSTGAEGWVTARGNQGAIYCKAMA